MNDVEMETRNADRVRVGVLTNEAGRDHVPDEQWYLFQRKIAHVTIASGMSPPPFSAGPQIRFTHAVKREDGRDRPQSDSDIDGQAHRLPGVQQESRPSSQCFHVFELLRVNGLLFVVVLLEIS